MRAYLTLYVSTSKCAVCTSGILRFNFRDRMYTLNSLTIKMTLKWINLILSKWKQKIQFNNTKDFESHSWFLAKFAVIMNCTWNIAYIQISILSPIRIWVLLLISHKSLFQKSSFHHQNQKSILLLLSFQIEMYQPRHLCLRCDNTKVILHCQVYENLNQRTFQSPLFISNVTCQLHFFFVVVFRHLCLLHIYINYNSYLNPDLLRVISNAILID